MKEYDYVLAKKIIDFFAKLDVLLTASLGIHEDWFWTADTVYSGNEYVLDLDSKPNIAGISGSRWGTPVLSLDLKDETTKVFKCFEGEEKTLDILSRIEHEMLVRQGCITNEVQEKREDINLEEFTI